jgi:transcriptional regulator with PAS, ATPase and Fis domain
MRTVLDRATRVAQVDSTVLITGESGVGKERLARFIHRASPRAKGPFIAVNCCALPDALIESELFGHARGAFTGAMLDRPGLFEAADGGTLLLDEVGDMPLSTQVKLLRVLQEHEIRRVGENRQRRVNVRVVAATNRELAADVAERRFRQDLYYRLRVIDIQIPPLRERLEDLRILADTLLRKIAREMRRTITGYTTAAIERIVEYSWPGNIRELENAIERACALAVGALIDVDDLPVELSRSYALACASGEVRPLREIERQYILAVLQRNGGNRTRTAHQLRINDTTLLRKLKGYAKAS